MPVTMQDPAYRRMYQRSHILKKFDDVEIPLVPKTPGIKNHGLTTFVLSSIVHFMIYPLDTIKTRLISHNKISDIAKFNLNKTKNQTAYLGIFRGYFSVLIGNSVHLALGQQNFALGAIIEGLLKTWIDMMKITKQMANKQADLQIMRKTCVPAAFFGILRDLTYRSSFFILFQKLNAKLMEGTKFDEGVRLNNMFGSVIISTLISQPFEVIFTKIASQRQLKYTNILKLPIQIVKEEGYGKLIASGLWPRITYNIIATSIMFNFYDKLLEASLQAI